MKKLLFSLLLFMFSINAFPGKVHRYTDSTTGFEAYEQQVMPEIMLTAGAYNDRYVGYMSRFTEGTYNPDQAPVQNAHITFNQLKSLYLSQLAQQVIHRSIVNNLIEHVD